MNRIIMISAALVMLCSSMPVFGWGQMGHDVVAAIAEQNLTKKSRKALEQ